MTPQPTSSMNTTTNTDQWPSADTLTSGEACSLLTSTATTVVKLAKMGLILSRKNGSRLEFRKSTILAHIEATKDPNFWKRWDAAKAGLGKTFSAKRQNSILRGADADGVNSPKRGSDAPKARAIRSSGQNFQESKNHKPEIFAGLKAKSNHPKPPKYAGR